MVLRFKAKGQMEEKETVFAQVNRLCAYLGHIMFTIVSSQTEIRLDSTSLLLHRVQVLRQRNAVSI